MENNKIENEARVVDFDILNDIILRFDEYLFLSWLLHYYKLFYYSPFPYSMDLLRSKLNIKRYRLKTIMKKFIDWGVLITSLEYSSDGTTRWFEMDYIALRDNLDKVMNKESKYFNDFIAHVEHLQVMKDSVNSGSYEYI